MPTVPVAASTLVSVHRDDVSELGSTASRAMSEHNSGSEIHHCDGHHHRHCHQNHFHQKNEAESVRSCGSLSTVQSESEGASFANTTEANAVAVGSTSHHGGGRRKKERHLRRKMRGCCCGSKDCASSTPAPVLDNVHFEGHLLHRVCGVTGRMPGGGGRGGCNSNSSDEDSDEENSEVSSLLEDSGEYQLARLRRNPEMMRILTRLKALSASLVAPVGQGIVPGSSSQPGGAGNAAGGRRADTIRLAQEEYLRLFEEMLGELLKTQREKSKVGTCAYHKALKLAC